MAPDSWLMLGAGETPVGQTQHLEPENGLIGIFRPSGVARPARRRAAG